jgi:proteasome alpha subunit
MFHILYDGTVMDERDYAALGGDAETINGRLAETWSDGLDRRSAIALGRSALGGPDREIADDDLEVADLARTNGRRCFHRLTNADLSA